ncbi:MAG: SDR family oxidoreductase [Cyanobacteriota bacterium]
MKLKKILPILGIIAFYLYKKSQKIETNFEERFVVVTGASTGIGRSIAEELSQNGYKVFATVRKDSDFETLSKLSTNLIPIKMDVTDHDSIIKAKEVIKDYLGEKKLYSLINNAGIAVGGPMELINIDEVKRQFDVNYFGVLDTTQIFFDLLDKNNSKIINMSSVGGKTANPFMGAYNSSKFALEAMSDSLRREIFDTNIEVVVIEPGMIATPIWDKADEIDIEKYKDSSYVKYMEKAKKHAVDEGRKSAPVEKVSQRILEVLSRKCNNSRYWVSGNPLLEVFIPRVLPDKLLDFIVKKALKS